MQEGQERKGKGELEDQRRKKHSLFPPAVNLQEIIIFLLKLSFLFPLLFSVTKNHNPISLIVSYQIKKAEKNGNAKRNEYAEDSYALLEVN